MTEPRVIFTVPSLAENRGGPSRSVPELCTALADQGAPVEIVFVDHGSGPVDRAREIDGRVRTAPVSGRLLPLLRFPWSSSFRKVLLRRCRESQAQIIHDAGVWLPSSHCAAGVARRLDLPFVASPRGLLTEWTFRYKGWKKKLAWNLYARRNIRSARVLHATSTLEARDLRALGLKQPIAVIPNGVDMPEWREPPERGSGPRTALFLSRVHPKKGLLNLVAAWARIRPSDWRVMIVGSDEMNHRDEVRKAAHDAGLEGVFQFSGPVYGKAKSDLYRTADLFVLPTFSESFGVVVAEALAFGVPAITTKGAPWSELERHRCGWWIEIGAEPLAAALREATRLSDAERREMGSRGRELIKRRYVWPRVAAEMLGVYTWILGGAAPPACVVTD